MAFNTPYGQYRFYHQLPVKEMKCAQPWCRKPFMQNAPVQIYCSYKCSHTAPPMPPRILKIFYEYQAFIEKHGIPSNRILQPLLWDYCILTNTRRGTISLRSRVARQLKIIMDRFRRGFYVYGPDGVKLQNPPWTPFCPIDRTYCTGAILPGDCPRRLAECAYSKNNWREVLEARGYELNMAPNRTRDFNRRSDRALLSYNTARNENLKPEKPDDDAIRQYAGSFTSPARKKSRHGVRF